MHFLLPLLLFLAPCLRAEVPRLRHSDVVFMYAAADHEFYRRYGATWVAWGPFGNPDRIPKIKADGIVATGDLWALTAGPKKIHDDPALADAVARDIRGEPIEVPWQADQEYKGTKTYFGCTNAPAFQQELVKNAREAVRFKPDGLHLDDPSGVYSPVDWLGGCYCRYCMAGFREYLLKHDSPELRAEARVGGFKDFDYASLVKMITPTRDETRAKAWQLPLRRAFLDFQLGKMLENTRRIRDEAKAAAGKDLAFSVNAYFEKPGSHFLAFSPLVTHFVAELNHHAGEGTAKLWNVVQAYRQAEAVGLPLASTASGGDYAYVKERNAVNLVKIWIALSYACGQRLMVPHPENQWCHTDSGGTSWYKAPAEAFTPYYRFVRQHASLFDGHETIGPLSVVPRRGKDWKKPEDRAALAKELESVKEPQKAGPSVWVFPRRGPGGSLVFHLVNTDYDPKTEQAVPQAGLTLSLPKAWIARRDPSIRLLRPDGPPEIVKMDVQGDSVKLHITALKIWALIAM